LKILDNSAICCHFSASSRSFCANSFL